jgi:muramoyltetrapeptide carboxypeptidase
VDPQRLETGIAELRELGFEVQVGEAVLARSGLTAGDAGSRCNQLQAAFADDAVAAIVCARGGAGAGHLLPLLDTALLRAHPKLLLGFSDISALHLLLNGLGLPSLHGPMAAVDLAPGRYHRASLWHALTGEGEAYRSEPDDLLALREGEAEGRLRGGCLSLLAAAAGTPWALAPGGDDTLLFLEDKDEPPYRVDRMLRQLRASGAFDGAKGVLLGDMQGCAAGRDADYDLEGVVLDALAGLDIPVALGLSSGHAAGPQVTLPLGVRARLHCSGGEARFEVLGSPTA